MIFLLAKKDFPAPKHLNIRYQNNDVCLYLDGFWETTDTGFYKGYEYEHVKIDIADGVIEISMPFYHQSKTFYNNDTGLIITNNYAHYGDNNPCSIDHFKYDGQSHFTETVIPDFEFNNVTFEYAAKVLEEKIAQRINAACSKFNKNAVFFSGGLDTASVFSVIKKHNFPVAVNFTTKGFDIPELLERNIRSIRTPLYNSYIEKVESYKECVTVEPFEGLFTGFCGGVETLSIPHHATSIMNCYGIDYHEEINKNMNAYLSKFHISETIPDNFPIYEGTDINEARKFVLNQILHNKEILPIDHHNILCPWRIPEAPQLVLGMSIKDLTYNTFHRNIQKVIIENNYPDAIKLVPKEKYETINNYRAFPPNKRRWGDTNN